MKGDEGTNPPNIIPLRTILRNFLNVVESCEAGRISGVNDQYEKEFHELKQYSESLKSDPDYQSKEGEKSVNRKKNRYKDILPFDYTRVPLADYGDIPGSDYINANFIKGASGSSAYIACQGPLAHTVNDFWRMVVECEVQVVVMACMEQESGKHKCENYWVEEDGVEKEFGQVTVWLKKCRNVCPDFLVRTMRIRFPNSRGEMEERNVCQFHYSAWPDHGVPTKVRPLLDMVRLIRDCQTSETLPVLVHCSAGCGRTGTICAIDYVWGLLRLGKLTPDFSLFQLVRDMRRQRIAMVQTKDQYILVHRAVKELFQDQLKIIEAHHYANVNENGLPFDIKQDLEEPTYETIEFDTTGAHASQDLQSAPLPTPPPGEKIRVNSIKSKMSNNSVSRIKLKKEVENRKEKQKEQVTEKVRASRAPEPIPQNEDQIDAIEKYDCTDSRPIKVPTPSSHSPIRTALLRKPSMVKLKAFFEKSPKEEKKGHGSSGGSQLSRAKSDVSSSSRFYAFASAFGSSRGHLGNNGSNNNNEPVLLKSLARTDSPNKDKVGNGKPPVSAKPILPIKRSKSLKIHPTESSPLPSKLPIYKATPNGSVGRASFSKSNSSSSSGFSTSGTSNNPIKVCVKQVDIPKLQSVVSRSVKAEARTAHMNSYCSENESSNNKPMPSTSRDHVTPKDNHNYVNIPYGNNRIKMGIAKEMEDVSDYETSKRNSKFGKIKKYDTVNPRSLAGSGYGNGNGAEIGGTTLTRSQSHVWQPERVHLIQLERIFSDENIHSKSLRGSPLRKESQLGSSGTESNSKAASRLHSGNQRSPISNLFQPLAPPPLLNSTNPNSSSRKGQSSEEPIVRRRVPRTNPYTNFPSTGTERHSPAFIRIGQNRTDENTRNTDRLQNGTTNQDYLPQLYNGSANPSTNGVGNSSDSSSNAGTPRNSLLSTPSESTDVLYPNLLRSNGNGTSSPKFQRLGHNGGPPKSILKGSLSSTPSESEERLNNHSSSTPQRGLGHSLSNNLTHSPLSGLRVGVRERRNSFRQAVWKEAPTSGDCQSPYQPQPVYSSAAAGAANVTLTNHNILIKSHKDYEPIWPDGNTCTTSKTFLNVTAIPDQQPVTGHNRHNHNNGTPIYANSRPTDNHFEKSNGNGNGRTQNAPLQSRMDEIKLLLKELKTPIGGNDGGNRQGTSPSNNLKYQRSLKAPTRAQYQENGQVGNSLSCFTLKKPSSLESLTDQFQSQQSNHSGFLEDYQPLLSGGSKVNPHGVNPQHRFGGPHASDYVPLRHSRTSDSSGFGGFEIDLTDEQASVKRTPIPPPRTKTRKTQQPMSTDQVDKGDTGISGKSGVPLSLWTGKNQNRSGDVVDSRGDESGQPSRANGTSSASPKAIIRAIGLFQAKAANVRSRFSNWAETKERSSSQQSRKPQPGPGGSSGSDTSYILREQVESPDDDSGFTSPIRRSSTTTQIGPSRATKHQYL